MDPGVTAPAYGLLCAEMTMMMLYRRRVVQLLRCIWAREEELERVLADGIFEPQALWHLRNLTAACMEAIEGWRLIFPWNRTFLYAGKDYVAKCDEDLEVLQAKMAPAML